jgi:hypothetical protein
MTGSQHQLCRATQSAHAWRRDRMIERRAARIVADQAADAAGPDRSGAAEPITMEVAGRARLEATRHVLIAPEQSLEGRAGRWIV